MSAIYLQHAAEIWANDGPTGKFAEVTEGKVVDYGNNVLFSGSADDCGLWGLNNKRLLGTTPHRWIATKWTPVEGEVAGASRTWSLVIAK